MTTGQILAINIRRIAEKKGVGINNLADFAGVSRSQLYDVLGAKKSTTVDWLDQVAEVLETPVHELLRKQAKRRRN